MIKKTTRTVVITNADSVVRISIPTFSLKPDPENNKIYYWYMPDCIRSNLGGYSGYLLHGEYCVFDKNSSLIEKGAFENGLKTGVWNRWYPQGNLLKKETWKNGFIDGLSFSYNTDGSVLKKVKYRRGVLIGKPDNGIKTAGNEIEQKSGEPDTNTDSVKMKPLKRNKQKKTD
jgi:hypothetical protein